MSKASQRKITVDPVKQPLGAPGLRRPRSSQAAAAAMRATAPQKDGVEASAPRRERFQILSVKYTERSIRH
jgi:hypothetical protein